MRKTCSQTLFWMLALAILQVSTAVTDAAPRKQRVLYLGDSMSMGAFGKTLDNEIRDAGYDVYTFVAGGATPYYWLSRYSTISGPIGYWEKTPGNEHRKSSIKAVPKIEKLLERFDPDVVVVQTGTNLYSTLRSKRRSKENNVKEVEGLLNHMIEAATQGGRQCYWITPPQAHVGRYPAELQAELASLTKRVVGREARVFDSRSVTKYTDPYPKNDGIHYGPTEAKAWAQHVVSDFRTFMGNEPPQASGHLLASAPISARKKGMPIQKAVAVKQAPAKKTPAPIEVKSTPPVKVAKTKPLVAKVQPKVVEKPPKPKPAKRPPVQYVKKAIPVEMKGVQWGELDLELELITKSELKSLTDIDYSYCFAMNEYRVTKVNSGYYPYPRIRIARVVMWGKKPITRAINEKVGNRPRGGWKLVPMSRYPRFEQMQLVDELPIDLDLPIYIIAFE